MPKASKKSPQGPDQPRELDVPSGDGLNTTFELLARTANEAAADVLLAALESADEALARRALDALLRRRSLAGQHAVLRQMHRRDDAWRAVVYEHRGTLSQALRDAVLSDDQRWCANGCEATLWFHEYDLMPTLLNVLDDDSNPQAALAANTARELAELFYQDLSGSRDFRPRRDPQLMRRHLVGALEDSVKRFSRHRRVEPVEAFLLLADRGNSLLKQILFDPLHASYLVFIDLLTHSQRPGVIRLLLSYLDDPHAPSAALTAIAHRADREFVGPLLRKIGGEPAPLVKRNLARIDAIAWLRGDFTLLDSLDDACQHSAVELVTASGMNRLLAYETIAHLVQHGRPGGRRSATAALAQFHGSEANQLALTALDDADPQVQAAAICQLRERGIPGAVSILLERTESEQPVVRQAARDSLAEFSFSRYLAAFDMLDEPVRQSTGLLVRKVDSRVTPLLVEELVAPSKRRRIRALQVAEVMQLVLEVQDHIIALLGDEDHLVRLGAARALGHCATSDAYAALREAEDDTSPVVREAVSESLERIGSHAAAEAASHH